MLHVIINILIFIILKLIKMIKKWYDITFVCKIKQIITKFIKSDGGQLKF